MQGVFMIRASFLSLLPCKFAQRRA